MRRTRALLAAVTILMLGDFIVRGVVPAYTITKNDFSDPYCASWLWRHGQNPYDRTLATAVNEKVVHSAVTIVPVYPPTTYLLVSPLSILPWKLANLAWALLGVAGVAVSAFVLLKLAGFTGKDDAAWVLIAFVFAFSPLHTAVHVANIAAIVTGATLLGVWLAEEHRDLAAAVVLAISTCLKPQIGIWVLLFYVLRRRWKLVPPAAAMGLMVSAIAVLRIPVSLATLLQIYGQNLHFWFNPGGMNDFSAANLFRFELVNVQVALYPLAHTAAAANVLAWTLFGLGFVVWGWSVLRCPVCSSQLAVAPLLALTMLPIYHRSYDTSILLLALCGTFGAAAREMKVRRRAIAGLLLVLMVPTQIFLSMPLHWPAWASPPPWLSSAVKAHRSWVVLLLSIALLRALMISCRELLSKASLGYELATPTLRTVPIVAEEIPVSLRELGA